MVKYLKKSSRMKYLFDFQSLVFRQLEDQMDYSHLNFSVLKYVNLMILLAFQNLNMYS